MGGRKSAILPKSVGRFAHIPLYELSSTFVGGLEVGVTRAFEGSYTIFEAIRYEFLVQRPAKRRRQK